MSAETRGCAVTKPATASDPIVAAYSWDLASDRLEWDGDPTPVLGVGASDLATGHAFEAYLAPEQRAARRAVMVRDPRAPPSGTLYHVRIGFLSGAGGEPIWLDETGRVWRGADGTPVRAQGWLRRTDEQFLADQRLLVPRADEISADGLNRARFLEGLGACLKRAERTKGLCALFMASVNDIEAVNAHLGFDIGDELIAETGHILRSGTDPKPDLPSTIYRYASNTLAIIADIPALDALEPAASDLRARIRDTTIQTSAGPLRASISVGAVAIPIHASAVSEAIAHALDALELAKREGQSFVAHRPMLASERARRREQAVSSSVVAALEGDRLLLALQPIVDAESGKPVYYEGLLRLRREDGTLVSAAEFVADAEKLGLARLIDMRALELGLALLAKHPRLTLSLNVSSLTAGDTDWIAALQRATSEAPGLAQRLIIEITETAMIHDIDRMAAFVDLVRGIGCKVAIDDFGAGFTSFRFLKALKVDVLKIDGMFVADLPHDEQGRVIVKTMIDMAKALKLETVAEWVSDEASRAVLREAGANYLQGFLFGKPVLVEDAERQGLL
jgi:diguanylate cyclase (GGDEF)-like protein